MTSRRIQVLRKPFDRVVRIPGSKSITNRALVCAALANGISVLTNVLFADDTEAMLAAISQLGAHVTSDRIAATVTVVGNSGKLPTSPVTLDARQSGTTARFLLPVAALSPARVVIDGHAQLKARPMGPLLDACVTLGVGLEALEQPGHLPIAVTGHAGAVADHVDVTGDVSSQFLSGLMLAAPWFGNGLDIRVTTPLVSRPYVTMTAAVMRAFGADVIETANGWRIAPTGYRAAANYAVEPDASAASYFFAAAAITGSRVTIEGLGSTSIQGDADFVDALADMGATVITRPHSITVSGDADLDDGVLLADLESLDIDMADMSDTAPTLAIVAACADGTTEVTGIGFIRGKETDRIAAVVAELSRVGITATETEDGMSITGGHAHGAVIETYDDHRMAMSFAILGLVVDGIEIDNPECVNKTFPTFWDVLNELYV